MSWLDISRDSPVAKEEEIREVGKTTPKSKICTNLFFLLFCSASRQIIEAANVRLKITVQKATGKIGQLQKNLLCASSAKNEQYIYMSILTLPRNELLEIIRKISQLEKKMF